MKPASIFPCVLLSWTTKTVKPINAARETAMGSRSPAGPRRLGTAMRISASLLRRLSAFFWSTLDQAPKAAKFAVLTPGPTGFPNHAKRSEGSDTTPSETPRVLPCEPLCARLGAGVACTRRSPLKRTLRRLCEYDLEPRWRGLSHAIWDAPSAYFRQIRRLAEDFIYSRIKGWRRNRRSARSLLPAVRAVDGGFNAGGCGVYSEDFLYDWRLSSV